MRGSARGRYGLQVMTALAAQAGAGPQLVEAVATAQDLPPKFIRVLLGPLKAAGLVKVQRGPSGGCELAKPPGAITALAVLEALEGRLGAGPLPSQATPGAQAVGELWVRSTEAARQVLGATTLAELAERQRALAVDRHDYAI